MQIGRIYRTWRWHRCCITHDVYRERWCIGQHKTLLCDVWLFANIMLLKRSIKNESVQSDYFPRGGFINISTRWCTRARRERERERERCKRERKSKERKLTMCPDRRMSSKPWLYVFLSCKCVCVCNVVCRLTCDVSLPKRVPFQESKFASKKDRLCNTKSQYECVWHFLPAGRKIVST